MKKKINEVTIIAILMVAVIIMGSMMLSTPKNNKIKRIALTATTTSVTTTSTTVTTTTMTSTITTVTTTTTATTTATSKITTTNTSTTTLVDTTTVTTTTSPVESTTDTYEATVIYKEEEPEPIELFNQELYYEPIEMIEDITISEEETTVEDKDIYYFYEGSMRVHTPSCVYADPSCMEIIEDGYIDCARRCTECNPDIEIGTIYEEPIIIEEDDDDTYYEESDGLTRNWTVDEMTYYSGPYGCYGAAGRTLINNYSVACNSIPLGTIVYIQSSDGSVDGYYRVDDTGGMGDNVIDIFYSDYSNTPYSFRQAGRVSCTVWIAE